MTTQSIAYKRRLVRTLRCKNRNVVGTLAGLLTIISEMGVELGMIKTVALGEANNVRDISILVNDEAHLDEVIERIRIMPNVELVQVIDEVLDCHLGGKIKVMPTYPVETVDDLRKVYTPGVAQVTAMIKRNPKDAIHYTSIPKNVALITNGSRVLGLGNTGPVASMPVMEGKAALFAQFTGLNMIPILLETRDPDKFVETVMAIHSGFAAIQLEDIEAPQCFEIEERLKSNLQKPVMHDDQHGTAVVALAAAINASKLCHQDLKNLKIGQVGLGAAGLAIARLIQEYTGTKVMGTDLSEEAQTRFKAIGGVFTDLETIMKECQFVISTTGRRNLIKPEMIQKGQIILALSNPYPEIASEDAIKAGAAFAADGARVNNLLGYPGIFKGALKAQATEINLEMLLAASLAIVRCTPEGEIVPTPIQTHLHNEVARSVADAAFSTGVALTKPEEYQEVVED